MSRRFLFLKFYLTSIKASLYGSYHELAIYLYQVVSKADFVCILAKKC